MKIKTTEGLLAIFILLISIFTFRPAYDYTVVRLLIANIFVFFCALYFFGRRRPFSAPLPVLLSLTGFVLFVTVSVGYSVFPPATVRDFSHFLTYILIFLIASQIYPTPFVIGSWITSVVILSFTGLYDYNRIQNIVTPLGNKNFFAGYLILIIPITVTTLWQKIAALRSSKNILSLRDRRSLGAGRRGNPVFKNSIAAQKKARNNYLSLIALILAVIIFFILLVLADSQAADAGLVIGLLFLALISFGKFVLPRLKSGLRVLTLSMLIVALALTAFIGAKKGTPYVLKNVRYPLWKGSVDMIVQRPLTGFGPGTFLAVFQRFRPADYYNRAETAPLSDHSHNEYLELASESGLPALLFFLTFLTSVLALSIRKLKNNDVIVSPPETGVTIPINWFLLAGLVSGLIAILVDGLFSTNLRTFSVIPVFWLLLGFCTAVINKTPDINPRESKIKPIKNLKTPSAASLKLLPQASFIWIAIMVFNVFCATLIIREVKGQVYYKEGIAARNAQNWAGAISKYRKALELEPANLQAAYKLSFVYANANQTEDAINLYREILRVSPNFAKTYYNLALLSLRLNDKDSAVSYLNLSLRYDPYDTEAQRILNILTNKPGS
ncbi:MAG: O-antigen ligase family protein [Candidatus Omnitrophota bacterium]